MIRIPLGQFEQILPATQLEQLALEYKVDRCNQVRLPGQAVFACLLDAQLSHELITQRLLEETYERKTGIAADHSSFGKRLAAISPLYFQQIFEGLYTKLEAIPTAGEAQALHLPYDQNSLRLKFVDCTLVHLSAKLIHFGLLFTKTGRKRSGYGYRAMKSVVSLTDDGLPRLLRLSVSPDENSDARALGKAMKEAMRPNDLWVFDAGCHDRHLMAHLHQKGAYFLTPHSTQGLQNTEVIWQADLPNLTETEPNKTETEPNKDEPDFQLVRVERSYFGRTNELKADKEKWQQMPLMVVHGLRWDKRAKSWKEMRLMTNLPLSSDPTQLGPVAFQIGPYSFLELAALYRRRWEIETFFKFIKQHLGYSHLVSRTENGVLVMIWMSLITALLLIWYKRCTQIDRGWRSVKFWLANDAQQWTQEILFDAMEIQRTLKKQRALKKMTRKAA